MVCDFPFVVTTGTESMERRDIFGSTWLLCEQPTPEAMLALAMINLLTVLTEGTTHFVCSFLYSLPLEAHFLPSSKQALGQQGELGGCQTENNPSFPVRCVLSFLVVCSKYSTCHLLHIHYISL